MKHIVKRRGHTEEFDSRKVYGSTYAACLNAHLSHVQSEKIAETVSKRLAEWVEQQAEVSSDDIFSQTQKVLAELHKDAAFLYKTHRDIS